jgi:hypothetical protein
VDRAGGRQEAGLNCIAHLLSQFDYTEIEHPVIQLPERERHPDYTRHPLPASIFVPEVY